MLKHGIGAHSNRQPFGVFTPLSFEPRMRIIHCVLRTQREIGAPYLVGNVLVQRGRRVGTSARML
ncbi:MAG: hypothetical protein WAM20_09180, partial [Acidobacteriaceae bacterium]